MKLGVCSGLDNASLLQQFGYDYVEMGLSSIAQMNDTEFQYLKEQVSDSVLKPYAFNVFFPGSIKLTGPEADEKIINEYLIKALDRAEALGGKFIVFGSGGSRRVPEGFSQEKAFDQLVKFLKVAGTAAADRNITIVIEPLRKEETNIINTAAEGLVLAKAVNHPNIKLLVDFYHMTCENESAEIIIEAGNEYIKHLHIANPDGRVWPVNPDEANYKQFFKNLSYIGYTGNISIEGKTEDLKKDAPLSIKCLKYLLQND